MSPLVDQLLKSPRLRLDFDRIAEHLRREQAARARFRDEMNEDTRAEFINGETFVHSPAKFRHNTTAQRIFKLLDAYVSSRDLGHVGHEKYLVELTRNDVEPDVCFWPREVAARFTGDQMLFPAPSLVVEVLSESTEANDRGTKFDDYAAHGIVEYWIVDPASQVIEQYVLPPNAEQYQLRLKSADGTLRCVAIAGAEFPVRAFFDDDANRNALAALRLP